MWTIDNLSVEVNGVLVLKGVNLTIAPGEIHAIMGPNGSGKSTLSHVLAGHPAYHVVGGHVDWAGEDFLALSPEARAEKGFFLAFQYPIEIPGVNNLYFLKTAFNHLRAVRGEQPLDAFDFLAFVRQKLALIGMDEKFLKRSLNEGFSGGEKKRNEILQMLVLEPQLAVLDEIDSGLDVDALQSIATGVNALRAANRSILMVTHYQRLLQHIEPDFVHILVNGRIVKSGTKALAEEVESHGYAALQGAS
ncbi:MAG: Fe-S cluster assembly ATPase SufC [Gammaproteobacteria bacterium RIFCSPHIGHO2_12_FULL_45_9]|nr:MAG: Fe-S cluster assembly ATPase SufC [Gammaproteobacteria bacterium RIFCSPHIGHO2_12_FULL_45_9]